MMCTTRKNSGFTRHAVPFHWVLCVLVLACCSSESGQGSSAGADVQISDSANPSSSPNGENSDDGQSGVEQGDSEASESSAGTDTDSSMDLDTETGADSSADTTGGDSGSTDPCDNHPCPQGQSCHDIGGTATCLCTDGGYPLGASCRTCRTLDSGRFDIDVGIHRLTLDLTLNGAHRDELRQARLDLRDVYTGHTTILHWAPLGQLPITVPVLSGRYDLLYRPVGELDDDPRPLNADAAVVKNLDITQDLELTVDLRSVEIDLDYTINGENIDPKGIEFTGTDGEGWVLLETSSRKIVVLPGMYDICHRSEDCVHHRRAVELTQDGRLDFALNEIPIKLDFTIDGKPLEDDERVNLEFVGPGNQLRHSLLISSEGPTEFSTARPSPDYDVYYTAGSEWMHRPMNKHSLIARNVSLSESQTIDSKSVAVRLKITIDGIVPDGTRTLSIEMFDRASDSNWRGAYPSVERRLWQGETEVVVLPGAYDIVLVEYNEGRYLIADNVRLLENGALQLDLRTHEVSLELKAEDPVKGVLDVIIDPHHTRRHPHWPNMLRAPVSSGSTARMRLFEGEYSFRIAPYSPHNPENTRGSRVFARGLMVDRDLRLELSTLGVELERTVTVNGQPPPTGMGEWFIRLRDPEASLIPIEFWNPREPSTMKINLFPGVYGVYYTGPGISSSLDQVLPGIEDHFLECVRVAE